MECIDKIRWNSNAQNQNYGTVKKSYGIMYFTFILIIECVIIRRKKPQNE